MNYNNRDLVMSFFSSFKIRSPPSSPISGYIITFHGIMCVPFQFFFRENQFDLFILSVRFHILVSIYYMAKMSPYDMGGGLNIPDQVLVISVYVFRSRQTKRNVFLHTVMYCVPFLQGEGKMQCKNFYFSFLGEPKIQYTEYMYSIL